MGHNVTSTREAQKETSLEAEMKGNREILEI